MTRRRHPAAGWRSLGELVAGVGRPGELVAGVGKIAHALPEAACSEREAASPARVESPIVTRQFRTCAARPEPEEATD